MRCDLAKTKLDSVDCFAVESLKVNRMCTLSSRADRVYMLSRTRHRGRLNARSLDSAALVDCRHAVLACVQRLLPCLSAYLHRIHRAGGRACSRSTVASDGTPPLTGTRAR
jgi:hypothetical protein